MQQVFFSVNAKRGVRPIKTRVGINVNFLFEVYSTSSNNMANFRSLLVTT
jgi:hypothetical protein